MEPFKLLLVEDDAREVKTFKDTMERYCAEHEKLISLFTAETLEDSKNIINNSFDGAIVDIKLHGDNDAGNKLLDEIRKNFRIPVAIYTGNPENVGTDYFQKFKRGVGYDKPLDFLFEIYDTGLTRIFGGRGYIEDKMNTVFRDSVVPHLPDWVGHKLKGKKTEEALLRFVVNHIVELVDNDVETYFPEEAYVSAITSNVLKTGSIVKRQNSDKYYIVLSPACDLAIHNEKPKTDRILVCFIEPIDILATQLILKNSKHKILENDSEAAKEAKVKNQEKESIKETPAILISLSRNNKYPYFHYLPKTKAFLGGAINFRNVETFKTEDFRGAFENPSVQISAAFTKDIVARFSSYYARQGQPNFDSDALTF